VALDFLNTDELGQIREDLMGLVTDPQTGGSVIYQSFVSKGSFNPNTGGVPLVFAGTWVDMYRRPISEFEVENSGGRYQVGDYIYYAPVEILILPKKDDRLVDGGQTRYVVSFTTDSIEVFHSLVCRNLG
jgi:protocatechuate 3,4-dioxygenase beta subunit